ncbi:hypothetical protein VE03_09640 [Pseudogymnoascus sp. 23342-1-I1]|nr:hypothetical protein VE03_09640 [Pseudogymnoascus sp. 23342-1-I1]
MADHNSYLAYKRDTRRLIYWMVHASNSIIKSSAVSIPDATLNTTGAIKISAIVPTSKLIAKHINPVPSNIYRLFQSVISVRTATLSLYRQIVSKKPDPEIEKSNDTHKHFIDTLTEAFESLGGNLWASQQNPESAPSNGEDEDEVIFANKFSVLGVNDPDSGDEEDDAIEGTPSEILPAKHSKKKPAGKGKKGKRGKKGKGKAKAKAKPDTKEAKLDEVPLESYRIIEDEDGLVTDYLIAVYSLAQQWTSLRRYLQGVWHEVSYDGLNSAVAGTLCNAATAMVKQTESAIFVDFPGGHESYETVMRTITRGDPDNAQGKFQMQLFQIEDNTGAVKPVHNSDVDVKEETMLYAYWDLLDFIADFQKTRSGKPTKSMLSEIRIWDPGFNLQRASKEQRIKWRRSYTINWLYDLVNLFSSVVVQRINLKGQKIVLETVNWSSTGPWREHRTVYGLTDFAGDITSFAMQKPGTDVRQKILPRHVFQMQCIVDSFTVSRGWSIHTLRGHVLNAPAGGFRPRRDVDLFMDRATERFGHGYCQAVDVLTQLFEKDAMMRGDQHKHQLMSGLLEEFRDDFVNFLGESMLMNRLQTIAPSRFSHAHSNGLWEYSPYLCGVGLEEALEQAYASGVRIWDAIPEPMCIMHMHNMLVQKGFIKQQIGLYGTLQDLFSTAFFINGESPTSDFVGAFLSASTKDGSRQAIYQRRLANRAISRTAAGLHELLDPRVNRYFKDESFLRLCHNAEWVPERIPDEELPTRSTLGFLRMAHSKQIFDPSTRKVTVESTPLVRRARADGITDELILQMSKMLQQCDTNETVPIPEEILASVPAGFTSSPFPDYKPSGSSKSKGTPDNLELLDLLKQDVISDVCGARAFSSLNYVWVTARMMMLFLQIEDQLKRVRNPLWVRAYEQDPLMAKEKRASLTALVLAGEDDESMEIIAQEFQKPRAGFMDHIYWEDLDGLPDSKMSNRKPRSSNPMDDNAPAPACVMM